MMPSRLRANPITYGWITTTSRTGLTETSTSPRARTSSRFRGPSSTGSDSTGANGHRFSNLVGSSDSNGSQDTGHLAITWHHDWWADYVVERQPRVRFGRVHVFNNLYTSVGDSYCIGVGVSANLRTESNVFMGVKTPLDTTSYSDATSAVRSTGNVYSGTSGASPADLNGSSVFDPASMYTYTLDDTSGLQAAIESGAGPK